MIRNRNDLPTGIAIGALFVIVVAIMTSIDPFAPWERTDKINVLVALGTFSAAIAAVWTARYMNKETERRLKEERRDTKRAAFKRFLNEAASSLRELERRFGGSAESVISAFERHSLIKKVPYPVPIPSSFTPAICDAIISPADTSALQHFDIDWRSHSTRDISGFIYSLHRSVWAIRDAVQLFQFQMHYCTDLREANVPLSHLAITIVRQAKAFEVIHSLIASLADDDIDPIWVEKIQPSVDRLSEMISTEPISSTDP